MRQLTHDSWDLLYLLLVRLAKPSTPAAIVGVLSPARLTKYSATKPAPADALKLYAWNAHISAALMIPSHFAEVLTRNAVSEAIAAVYGHDWPWSSAFTLSLPLAHPPAYSPRRDLERTRSKHPTTGKVVADLKFAFWGTMFTARHHDRLWKKQIHQVFPNATEPDAKKLRERIRLDLDDIRNLRNRLAHHEPVISRNLASDLARMLELVELRSTETSAWLASLEEASTGLGARP